MEKIDWKKRFEDASKMLEEKQKEFERLQANYLQLEHDASMKNIDEKFEPILVRPDIEDEDYSKADYPYLGRSPHRRRSPDGTRRIPAQLSETGYHSEMSDTLGRSSGSRQSRRSRSRDSKKVSQKVDRLKNLKNQADKLSSALNSQRAELNKNLENFSSEGLSADEELSLIDSDIAAQKEMLKDADQKLNKILSNMENEIDEIDHDTSDQPEIKDLKDFLRKQSDLAKERLDATQEENLNLTQQNRQIAKDYKKFKSNAEKEIDDLKKQNMQLKRQKIAGSPKNKYDRRAQENLAEEQLRLALEEKLKDMWHPEQINERLTLFADSNFENTGDDELADGLRNIKNRSHEIQQMSNNKIRDEIAQNLPKRKFSTPNEKLEQRLKRELSGKDRELRQSKQNWQKSAKESNELSRQVNKLKIELSATVSELNEKDGLALALEKDIKRLKANLNLAQTENDQRQKRLDEILDELRDLKEVEDQSKRNNMILQNKVEDYEKEIELRNMELNGYKLRQKDLLQSGDSKTDRIRKLQEEKSETAEKLNLAQNENDIFKDQLDQYKKKLNEVQRKLKDRESQKQQIQNLHEIMTGIKRDYAEKLKDKNISDQFNDRFDEVLDALIAMERRLNSRNSSQTNRILDAIEDLQIKLSSLNLPEEFKDMRRKLRKLKKFLLSRDPYDEFFYVPSGHGPEHNENMNIDDTNKNRLEPGRESRPRRVRERSRSFAEPTFLLERVPVYPEEEIIYKVPKRSKKGSYDLVVTSRPELLAVHHSKRTLKNLQISL